MTHVIFQQKIKLSKTIFTDIDDFLEHLGVDIAYEEYLERKYQKVKNAPESEFVDL